MRKDSTAIASVPTSPAIAPAPPSFELVPIESIVESADNPRKHFNEAALEELTQSIRERGVLTPVLVRPVGLHYELGAGHRRFRAAMRARLTHVPAVIRPMSDVEFLELLVIENAQREDVHPLEEAEGYRTLIDRGGYDVAGVAAKVGKSESFVYQRLKLADLVAAGKKAFLEDTITAGHAILLARLQPEQQKEALAWALPGSRARQFGDDNEVASVRALATYIQDDILCDLTRAVFDTTDATLMVKAGACPTCPHRAGNQPALFPEIQKGDKCTAPTCFRAKIAAHLDRIVTDVQAKAKKKPVRISQRYNVAGGEKRIPGVVYRGDKDGYRIVTKDGCPHAEPAVVVQMERYDNREGKLGQVVTICRAKGCHRGEPRTSSSSSTKKPSAADRKRREDDRKQRAKEEQKRTIERAGREALLDAILEKVPKALGRDELQVLAVMHFEGDRHMDGAELVAQRHGWGKVPAKASNAFGAPRFDVDEKSAIAAIGEMSLPELTRLLVELSLAEEVEFPPWQKKSQTPLDTVARLYRLDVPGIQKAAGARVKGDGLQMSASAKAGKSGGK